MLAQVRNRFYQINSWKELFTSISSRARLLITLKKLICILKSNNRLFWQSTSGIIKFMEIYVKTACVSY